jgi:hypothetical protein
MLDGDGLDRIARRESVSETGAHHARKSGDEQSLLQVEFLDGGALLLSRHFAFFGNSGCARDRDTDKTDGNTAKNHQRGVSAEDFGCEDSSKNRRHQRPECGGVSKDHGHAERHPQVAHGQAEGEAAESPQDSENIRPKEAAGRRFVQHLHQVMSHRKGEDPRGNDPTEESPNQPVGFPCPILHPAIGNVEAGGSQTTEPVKKHA